jgi:hypothetical protein
LFDFCECGSEFGLCICIFINQNIQYFGVNRYDYHYNYGCACDDYDNRSTNNYDNRSTNYHDNRSTNYHDCACANLRCNFDHVGPCATWEDHDLSRKCFWEFCDDNG